MKKFIAMLICAVLSIGTIAAQNNKTYTGFVVDKNGSPVVGAEVMAPGGGVTTITDSDGSFTIEVPFMLKKLTASYTGMRDKSLKLGDSSNLIYKMKNLKKMTGFISFVGYIGAMTEDYDRYDSDKSEKDTYISTGAGIMGGQIGQLGNWGWYVKGSGGVGDGYIGFGSLTAGAIRKLAKKTHLYLGGGIAYVYEAAGFSIDLGTIFTVSNHVNIIAGLNYMNSTDKADYYKDKYNIFNVSIGVGYTF